MTSPLRPEPPSQQIRAAKDRLLAAVGAEPVLPDGTAPTLPASAAPTLPASAPVVADEVTPWFGLDATFTHLDDDERYEFGDPFASGGLGLIRRARDRRLGRVVAVKELLHHDPAAERRFVLEAAITARLQHPSIIPLYDIGRHVGGEPYYCMKLVDGESLERSIHACKSLPERMALLDHVIAAADAVAHAHRHGVIHRDLKPANILVGERGETVVIDWGLAKDTTGAISSDIPESSMAPVGAISNMTDYGSVLGTLRYMPPEQARGDVVDTRSDVFALGAVLFHVLAGLPPHAGIDAAMLFARVCAGLVDRLRPRVPDAPPELLAIAERAMAPRPEDRYESAEAFAEDLRRFRTGRLVDAHNYSTREVVRRWLQRHRVVVAVTGAALLTVASFGLIAVQNIRDERDRAENAQRAAIRAQKATDDALQSSREQTREALLAQAASALATDLAAVPTLLARLEPSDEMSRRRAYLLALAAESRGAPNRVLRGHVRPIAKIVPLAGGQLVSVDVGGVVWRWSTETGEGITLFDLAEKDVVLIAARDVPAFAAIGEARAYVVREDGDIEIVDVSPVGRERGIIPSYDYAISAGGETLAALGVPANVGTGAPAYLWDLRDRPARLSALPGEREGAAALRPDGRAVAVENDLKVSLFTDGQVTDVTGLQRPHGFSSSGAHVYGFAKGGELRVVAVTPGVDRTYPLGRWVLATAQDDHALSIEFSELLPLSILALRSLATGEARWTRGIASQSIVEWRGSNAEFDTRVAAHGDGLALRIGDRWLLGSLATGNLTQSLETGRHVEATWLDGDGFALARHNEIWIWDAPVTQNGVKRPTSTRNDTLRLSFPPPTHINDPWDFWVAPSTHHELGRVFTAIAPDGSRAVGHWDGENPTLFDMSTRTELASPCLTGVSPEQLRDAATRLALNAEGRLLYAGLRGVCLQELSGFSRLIEVPGDVATVGLAERGEGYSVGLMDGTLLRWPGSAGSPVALSLASTPARVKVLSTDASAVAIAIDGGVFAVRDDVATRIATFSRGQATPSAIESTPIALHPKEPIAALALSGEDSVLRHDFSTGMTTHRAVLLPKYPSLAYSREGRLAVALAGRQLLVLDREEEHVVNIPEEIRAAAWLDEEQLAVLGDRGSLIRADVGADEAVVLRHEWSRVGDYSAELVMTVQPSGAATLFNGGSFDIVHQQADSVPRNAVEFTAWLGARGAALAAK